MDDLMTYATLLIAGTSMFVTVYILRLFPSMRKATREWVESSGIVSGIVSEIDSRLMEQDRRIADLMVKVDVLEERMMRGGVGPTRVQDFMTNPRQNDRMEAVLREKKSDTLAPSPDDRMVEVERRPRRVMKSLGGPTPVELQILRKMATGPITAPEVKDIIGSSREHAARIMKGLYEKGFVLRLEDRKPFTYKLSEKGMEVIK
jgi:hypothetical protein